MGKDDPNQLEGTFATVVKHWRSWRLPAGSALKSLELVDHEEVLVVPGRATWPQRIGNTRDWGQYVFTNRYGNISFN